MRFFLGISTFQLTSILHNHTTGRIFLLVATNETFKNQRNPNSYTQLGSISLMCFCTDIKEPIKPKLIDINRITPNACMSRPLMVNSA